METVDKKTGEVINEEHSRGLASLNARGEEILDDTPLALPIGFKRPQSLQERMRYLLRNELIQRDLDAAGIETFEEADDFEVGEQDPLEGTPYEDHFEPEIPGLAAREQEIRAGAVADRPLEKKVKAAETIKRHWRKSKKSESKAKEKAKPEPEPENGDDEQEDE